MSTELNQVIIQMGVEPARNFSEDCEPGDWEVFDVTFPTPFPNRPRVIVTANDLRVEPGEHNAAVVGLARQVTDTDFKLAARNSDCARGDAGFNWMAVLETPGEDVRRVPELRMGVTQPKHFQPDCESGDWQAWGVTFSSPVEGRPITLLTASNLNVTPFHTDDGLKYQNAAAVGIARQPASNAFTLAARNSDCAEGDCAFYHVALSEEGAGRGDMILDSGSVGAQSFKPDCEYGDWRSWSITFHEPFLAPPIVLVTANDRNVKAGNVAVVGIAQNVTAYGFTLSGRNSDCAAGQAGFYWVAIGCGRGCG